jgi:hypothetical protein
MQGFLDFVRAWAGMIASIYAEYPLPAALITLVAVGLFVSFERQSRSHDWQTRTVNFLKTFVVWAIAVPILGTLFGAIGKVWSAAVATVSAGAGGVQFLYGIYAHHPLMVIGLFALSAALFGVWHWRRPKQLSRGVKLGACTVFFFVMVALGGPLADVMSPAPTAIAAPATPSTDTNTSAQEPKRSPVALPANNTAPAPESPAGEPHP